MGREGKEGLTESKVSFVDSTTVLERIADEEIGLATIFLLTGTTTGRTQREMNDMVMFLQRQVSDSWVGKLGSQPSNPWVFIPQSGLRVTAWSSTSY
jgi:hypothetical protein